MWGLAHPIWFPLTLYEHLHGIELKEEEKSVAQSALISCTEYRVDYSRNARNSLILHCKPIMGGILDTPSELNQCADGPTPVTKNYPNGESNRDSGHRPHHEIVVRGLPCWYMSFQTYSVFLGTDKVNPRIINNIDWLHHDQVQVRVHCIQPCMQDGEIPNLSIHANAMWFVPGRKRQTLGPMGVAGYLRHVRYRPIVTHRDDRR